MTAHEPPPDRSERTVFIEKRQEFIRASEANEVPELRKCINTWPSFTELLPLWLTFAAAKGAVDTARYFLELGVDYEADLVKRSVDTDSIPMLKLL